MAYNSITKQFEDFVAEHWRQPEDVNDDVTFIYTCAAGECGEIVDAIKKMYRGKLGKEDIALEIGDTLHYLTKLCQHFGYTLEDIMLSNMAKLKTRFELNPEWLTERGFPKVA